jgi:phosphate transport system substrate-binding protein
MKLARILFTATATTAFLVSAQAQTVLRFVGATTLEKSIRPLAPEIGKAHNATLELVPNGAGRGLEDLVAGKANVAMFAGSLAYFAAQINEKTPGTVDPSRLKLHPLFEMPAVVVVHSSNTVLSLTHEQIRGLFSGTIANWSEVGGPNLPVVVVIPSPSDGVRSVVVEKLMQGSGFAASARVMQTAPDMNKVVAQLPGAVAFMSEKNASPEVRAIKPAQPIVVPFSLITLGEPAEPIKGIVADLQLRLK